MLDLGQSHFSCFFTSKLAEIAKNNCSHCAMALDNKFICLSTAPSNRIIALWVHTFMQMLCYLIVSIWPCAVVMLTEVGFAFVGAGV